MIRLQCRFPSRSPARPGRGGNRPPTSISPSIGRFLRAVLAVGVCAACARGEDADPADAAGAPPEAEVAREAASVERRIAERLAAAEHGIDQLADSIDDLLHPVPLLTAAQERAFARYANADHLRRAAALGIDPDAPSPDALVPLDSSGPYWIVRELDHSEPLVTPATLALLEEIGRRFQARLAGEGLPPYRFEITSALRTAASQADLRRTNPNAVTGRSSHEYGTTVDIAYAAFAAPREDAVGDSEVPEWLEAHITRDEAARLETVAARRSRELQAFLGEELLALQAEGAAYVMLEVRQPVFHITLARAAAGD